MQKVITLTPPTRIRPKFRRCKKVQIMEVHNSVGRLTDRQLPARRKTDIRQGVEGGLTGDEVVKTGKRNEVHGDLVQIHV